MLPPGVPELSENEANSGDARTGAFAGPICTSHNRPDHTELERATKICKRLDADVELMIFLREKQGAQLGRWPNASRGSRSRACLWRSRTRSRSHRTKTTPAALVRLVRDSLGLSKVPVAGGTDMYFCELNRTRPEVEAMDGLFWSVNPQVHAFDDISLVETPEAQSRAGEVGDDHLGREARLRRADHVQAAGTTSTL